MRAYRPPLRLYTGTWRCILLGMSSPPAPRLPAASDERQTVFLDTVLVPHRSLPPAGFVAVMAVLGGFSFVAGILFVLNGAWPVTGFFGLDVALVYVAFRINYRSARRHERITLVSDALTVERLGVRGERFAWRFQPYWLRVTLEEMADESNRLTISSHGRSLTLGSFLGAGERRHLATLLRDALARWRAHFAPR